jgi:DNA topoisomerase-1
MAVPSPATARSAGLRYSRDDRPGIGRRRVGDDWVYETADGKRVRDEATLERIRAIAIPPAWTDVWICPDARGHLQATGRDARGRKQYRYHKAFRARREAAKFEELIAFGEALPRIRERVEADLALPGLPKEKVLAACVRILDLTLVRVGNEEYAKANRSFGLTTLRDRHATIDRGRVRFRFRGKSGKVQEVGIRDRRLASIVKRCQDLPGQDLFQYVDDDGETRDVASDDVNEYLREIAGANVSAKMFRTWSATVLAGRALTAYQEVESARAAKQNVVEAMREVADRLGNTPTVARNSYVHPAVLEAYLDGSLGGAIVTAAEDEGRHGAADPSRAEEEAVIDLLRKRLAEEKPRRRRRRAD